MLRGLVFDPFAGISGDMILGALVKLGLEPGWLKGFVASLGLGDIDVVVEPAVRRGIACGRVRFALPHEHAHRHLRDVLRIVDASAAAPEVKATAGAVFRRLAEAEAGVHGTGVDEVHFHEVGALDAILDVLCVVAGIAELGVEACYARPVAVGTGFVDIAHGRFPLPAPATLRLLEGLTVRETGFVGECTTPTGAALLATLTGGRRAPESLVVIRSAYGAGTRDPEDRPNCLRLILCEPTGAGPDRLFMIQADVDDLPPEYVPAAQEAVLAAGARDVVASPLAMKKGRAGLRLEALVGEGERDAVVTALYRSTSTIGVRYWPVERQRLPRTEEILEWRGQRVRCKRVRLPDGSTRTKPEYEDVVAAARNLGLSAYQVRLALDGDGAVPAGDGKLNPASRDAIISLNTEVPG